MAEKILILGGTEEAAQLARELVAGGHDVTTALAGRTRHPAPVAGALRIGGFGGVSGLIAFLHENGFDRLIDATHPYARQISSHAVEAARTTGIAFEQTRRSPWQSQPGDNWTRFATIEAARDALPSGARVFLALGSQHIGIFADRADIHFLVRMIDPPSKPLALHNHAIITGRPPKEASDEISLLQAHAITHIVCRNSGGSGAYAKIEAARRLDLPVFLISR